MHTVCKIAESLNPYIKENRYRDVHQGTVY